MFVPFTGGHAAARQGDGLPGTWTTRLGLIVLYVILGLGTNLFIATGFIRSIPVSLEEAARIDGAGDLAHLLEDHLPADGADQRDDRDPDRTVGMERLPAAVYHR
jgi:hypothetical protein